MNLSKDVVQHFWLLWEVPDYQDSETMVKMKDISSEVFSTCAAFSNETMLMKTKPPVTERHDSDKKMNDY